MFQAAEGSDPTVEPLVRVTDRNAAMACTPSGLTTYLRWRGWEPRHSDAVSVQWTLTIDGDEFEVDQPAHRGLRDYALRVLDVLRTLAIVERRSELGVLRDLYRASTDAASTIS